MGMTWAGHLFLAACTISLTACSGGGGGGGSSSSGGTVTPPPPPSQSVAQQEVPDLFEFTMRESASPGGIETIQFSFTAPDSDLPQNFQYSGADGFGFIITFDASAADANGERVITVRLSSSEPIDFENPTDSNGDNVYEFTLTFTYKGESISTDIRATILDVPEAAVLGGEYWKQSFGNPLEIIPDLTGDGLSELGLSIVSGEGGDAAGFILRSEFLETASGQMSDTDNMIANFGTRFTETNPGDPTTANYVSGLADPSGTGVDLLVSEHSRSRAVLMPGLSASDFAAMQGDFDLNNAVEPILYTFPDSGKYEVRLLGDINNDGLNDLFVRGEDAGDTPVLGVILGRTPTSAADRNRTLDLDITLQTSTFVAPLDYESELHYFLSTFDVQLLPDLDGDNMNEFLFSFTSGPVNGQSTYLRSTAYSTTPVTLDIDSMPASAGWTTVGVKSIGLTTDFDNDGFPTLITSHDGILSLVDTDNLDGFDPNNAMFAFGPTEAIIRSGAGLAIGDRVNDIGDIDGDGLNEIAVASNQNRFVHIIHGATIENVLTNGLNHVLESTDFSMLDLRTTVGFASAASTVPHNLGDGTIAIGYAVTNSQHSSTVDSGAVIAIPANVMQDAFSADGDFEIFPIQ